MAQAISSTIPIVAITTQRLLPMSPSTSSMSGRTLGPSRASSIIFRLIPGGGGKLAELDPDHPRDVGVGLVERDAWTQPADRPEVVAGQPDLGAIEAERHQDVVRHRP